MNFIFYLCGSRVSCAFGMCIMCFMCIWARNKTDDDDDDDRPT